MGSIWKYIVKKVYKLLIFRVLLLDKSQVSHFDKLQVFCEYHFSSNYGPIDLIFKEDRRKYNPKNKPIFNSFVVEIKLPFIDKAQHQDVLEKVVAIVNFSLFKTVNYKYLAEVLMETYMHTLMLHVKENPDCDKTRIIKLK